MKSAAPTLSLCSLLLAAVLVAVSGFELAKRTHTSRAASDRQVLLSFAEDLQKELRRLDDVFEKDLHDLAEAVEPANTVLAQQLVRSVQGVRLCSILRRRTSDESVHVKASPSDLTSPAIALKPMLSRNLIVVPEAQLFDAVSASGWGIIKPRPPFDFYVQSLSPNTIAVLTIDTTEFESITRAHIAAWMGNRFDPARVRGETNRIVSPLGNTVSEPMPPAAEGGAHFAIPMTSRLGTWNLLSWDRLINTHSFHTPTLVVSFTLAVAIAFAGVMLSRAQRRAQQLAEQRVSFVNRVSHELGSPLTNMLLNLDLARELINDSPAEAQQRLALVEEETRRLARLTTNVLTFSRGERGSLQLKPSRCLPETILTQVLDHFTPALKRRGIDVETNFSATSAVLIDPDALAQITANLISNVEKYASSGAWMQLSGTVTGDQLIVRISDRGPGIPGSEHERIFRPFERLHDQVNEGSSGTGLGLSIARDLAERMGGALRLIESEQGAVFELSVPIGKPSDAMADKQGFTTPVEVTA